MNLFRRGTDSIIRTHSEKNIVKRWRSTPLISKANSAFVPRSPQFFGFKIESSMLIKPWFLFCQTNDLITQQSKTRWGRFSPVHCSSNSVPSTAQPLRRFYHYIYRDALRRRSDHRVHPTFQVRRWIWKQSNKCTSIISNRMNGIDQMRRHSWQFICAIETMHCKMSITLLWNVFLSAYTISAPDIFVSLLLNRALAAG